MDLEKFAHKVVNSANNDPEMIVKRFVELSPKEWRTEDGMETLQKALQAVLNALSNAWSDDDFIQKIKATFEAEQVFQGFNLFPEPGQESNNEVMIDLMRVGEIGELGDGFMRLLNNTSNSLDLIRQQLLESGTTTVPTRSDLPKSDLPKPLIEAGVSDIAEVIGRTLVLSNTDSEIEYYLMITGARLNTEEQKVKFQIMPFELNDLGIGTHVTCSAKNWIMNIRRVGSTKNPGNTFLGFETARIV